MLKKVLLDNAAHILRSRTDLMEGSLGMSGSYPGRESTPLLIGMRPNVDKVGGSWRKKTHVGMCSFAHVLMKCPHQCM